MAGLWDFCVGYSGGVTGLWDSCEGYCVHGGLSLGFLVAYSEVAVSYCSMIPYP